MSEARRVARQVWRSGPVRALRRRALEQGVLRRTRPVSPSYGFDRGTPVDRLFIERFLEAHRADLRGRVLEVQDRLYTDRYGHDLERVDVLDVVPDNPRATVVGDLEDPALLTPGAYDCQVVTQVLQFVEPVPVLRNLYAALAPGGVLLLTAPAVGRLSTSTPGDRQRPLPDGVRHWLREACPDADVRVQGEGNTLAAVATLLGLAVEDLVLEDLLRPDPLHPVVVTARVQRPPAPGGG